MQEELDEYVAGQKEKDLSNIVKELCDILYVIYNTIIEPELQDNLAEVFAEVHWSNITKEVYSLKVCKGKDCSKAKVGQFIN